MLKLSEVLGDLGVQYLLSFEILFDSVAVNWISKKLLEWKLQVDLTKTFKSSLNTK